MSSRNSLINFIKAQNLSPRWYLGDSLVLSVYREKLSGLDILSDKYWKPVCLFLGPMPSSATVGNMAVTRLPFIVLTTLLLDIFY